MYQIKYRKLGAWRWQKLTVKGDSPTSIYSPTHIVLIMPDETIRFIPREGIEFEFSKDRHYEILREQEQRAGQKIPTTSGAT